MKVTNVLLGVRWAAIAGLLAWIASGFISSTATSESPGSTTGKYVGMGVCADCHNLAANLWAHTIHAKVFLGNPRSSAEASGCEACHGPASRHVENPGDPSTIIRFSFGSPTPVGQQNEMCLGCHSGGERIHWTSSVHELSDLACSDCHNPMVELSSRGLLANISTNETCFGCHKTQRSEFRRRSHMPLLEGKLSCTDCHNPHGSISEAMIRTPTLNDTCFGCHAEKRGPFLFEHAPVAESCLNCHQPHGSNHEMLLVTARPLLCQQCHSVIGHPNVLLTRGQLARGSAPNERLIGRSCQNCHSQIHGSNHPSGAKFHR